jgi:O-antigen/teichoic acid export membrane protein
VAALRDADGENFGRHIRASLTTERYTRVAHRCRNRQGSPKAELAPPSLFRVLLCRRVGYEHKSRSRALAYYRWSGIECVMRCNAILVKRPNRYAELGLFNAASQWRFVIFFMPFTISVTCLPIATSLYVERRYAAYNKLLCPKGAINLVAVIALAAPIAILSGPLMSAYGRGFSAGATVLLVLSGSCLVIAIEYVTTHGLFCQGNMWSYLGYSVLLSVLLVTSTDHFVSRGLGPLGMAYAIFPVDMVKTACQTGHIFVTTRRALAASCD